MRALRSTDQPQSGRFGAQLLFGYDNDMETFLMGTVSLLPTDTHTQSQIINTGWFCFEKVIFTLNWNLSTCVFSSHGYFTVG